MKKSKEWIVRSTAIFLFVALMGISLYFVLDGWLGGHFDSFESFRDYIKGFGAWGPVILTLIQVLQVILPVLPGFLGCIVGAALFGANIGFWVNYIGISLGSIIAFMLARRYGVKLVNKMISMEKYESYIEKINNSKSYPLVLFLSILLPLAPDDFLCYFSGLINMSYRKFVTIILLAKPWCILIYSIFFAYFI